MQITSAQSEKLKRYMRNAHPFLWGVLEATNKDKTMKELREMLPHIPDLFNTKYPTYDKMLNDLFVKLNTEGIITQIIVKKLRTRVGDSAVLNELERFWGNGRVPDLKYLKDKRLYWEAKSEIQNNYRIGNQPADIFFSLQHNYRGDKHYIFVTEWTVFAGLYFEEILPYLNGQ